jgi:hypothetical protein
MLRCNPLLYNLWLSLGLPRPRRVILYNTALHTASTQLLCTNKQGRGVNLGAQIAAGWTDDLDLAMLIGVGKHQDGAPPSAPTRNDRVD